MAMLHNRQAPERDVHKHFSLAPARSDINPPSNPQPAPAPTPLQDRAQARNATSRAPHLSLTTLAPPALPRCRPPSLAPLPPLCPPPLSSSVVLMILGHWERDCRRARWELLKPNKTPISPSSTTPGCHVLNGRPHRRPEK